LDEVEDTGITMRPRLPMHGAPTGPLLRPLVRKSAIELTPKKLDPLTVVDDKSFVDRIQAETGLPKGFADELRKLYE